MSFVRYDLEMFSASLRLVVYQFNKILHMEQYNNPMGVMEAWGPDTWQTICYYSL
jgi:hypothetical protein